MLKNGFFFALAIAIGAVFLSAGHLGLANTFTRNLSLGMSGEDVKTLQAFLNKDPRTQIAISGVGSPGKETGYFGRLTSQAVARYQELHADTILTPAGLTKGSGYVGFNTRSVLETAITAKSTENYTTLLSTTSPWQTNGPISTLPIQNPKDVNTASFAAGMGNLERPLMAFFSTYEISPGETLTITGGGFTNTNTITFDTKYGTPFTLTGTSSNGTTITLLIPKDTAIGKYTIWVSNERGKTEYPKRLAVKKKGTPPPVVTSITPSSGTYGTEVTVTGVGFTPEDNEILGALSIMDLPSKDGVTLHFKIEPMSELFAPTTTPIGTWRKDFSWNMRLGVINANGLSSSEHPVQFQFHAE